MDLAQLRKPKILDMSIFDWATSLLGAFWLSYVLDIKWSMMFAFLLFWIAFGVAVHAYFNIPTMFGYYLGINEKPLRSN
jgi:hypothetical protein